MAIFDQLYITISLVVYSNHVSLSGYVSEIASFVWHMWLPFLRPETAWRTQ